MSRYCHNSRRPSVGQPLSGKISVTGFEADKETDSLTFLLQRGLFVLIRFVVWRLQQAAIKVLACLVNSFRLFQGEHQPESKLVVSRVLRDRRLIMFGSQRPLPVVLGQPSQVVGIANDRRIWLLELLSSLFQEDLPNAVVG